MADVVRVLGAVLGLDPRLFARIDAEPMTLLWPALMVALIAGASTLLGHVAILLLNHVRRLRLLSALLLSAFTLALLEVVQMVVTWCVASLALRRPLPLLQLVLVGLFSTAPLALNFLTAIPHFGMMLGRLWQAWGYLVVVVGMAHAFGLEFWLSLVLTLAGWVAMQLLSRLLHRPLNWLGSRAWTLATGRPTMITAQDILAGSPIVPVEHRQGARR
ncbi:MAG: hypothetical protein QM713_01470 [Arachnia sp.]